MQHTDVVIIGGGQAGLAMSRCLHGLSVDHIVLESTKVASAWQEKRWDSLKTLTPNWMTRLPGQAYDGSDPDGFMPASDVHSFLVKYSRAFDCPVMEETKVLNVSTDGISYKVKTNRGIFKARAVVLATGMCAKPNIPGVAFELSPTIRQLSASEYRNPKQVPNAGTLVVGASASGIQIAEELQNAGHTVHLAAGSHTHLPRTYRGRDIFRWMEVVGILDERTRDFPCPEEMRRQPSLQIQHSQSGEDLTLEKLAKSGVQLHGRLRGISAGKANFADDLEKNAADADRRLARLLARIEMVGQSNGLCDPDTRPEAPKPLCVKSAGQVLDLSDQNIETVIWATGYRRDYSWLDIPVLDAKGELVHFEGVTPVLGLFALGLSFLRRRKSSFIDGAGGDAAALSYDIKDYLDITAQRPRIRIGEHNAQLTNIL